MSAALIMDPNPATLKPDDSIRGAAQCIMEHRYRNVPVVDKQGRYLGMFGVNRLLKLVLPEAAVMDYGLDDVAFVQDTLADLHQRLREVENGPVTRCMNTELKTVPPDHPLVDTLLLLYRSKASIPVTDPDSGKLMGMISYWDVGKHILSA